MNVNKKNDKMRVPDPFMIGSGKDPRMRQCRIRSKLESGQNFRREPAANWRAKAVAFAEIPRLPMPGRNAIHRSKRAAAKSGRASP
jgi:hypothetical protein